MELSWQFKQNGFLLRVGDSMILKERIIPDLVIFISFRFAGSRYLPP